MFIHIYIYVYIRIYNKYYVLKTTRCNVKRVLTYSHALENYQKPSCIGTKIENRKTINFYSSKRGWIFGGGVHLLVWSVQI